MKIMICKYIGFMIKYSVKESKIKKIFITFLILFPALCQASMYDSKQPISHAQYRADIVGSSDIRVGYATSEARVSSPNSIKPQKAAAEQPKTSTATQAPATPAAATSVNTTIDENNASVDIKIQDDETEKEIADVKSRYAASLTKAQSVCPNISEKLNGIKTALGISVGGSVVGVAGSGTATVTGVMTLTDKNAVITQEDKANLDIIKSVFGKDGQIDCGRLTNASKDGSLESAILSFKKYNDVASNQRQLGTIGKVGSFVGAGGSAVAAVGNFFSVAGMDEIAKNIADCDLAISEINDEEKQLMSADMTDETLEEMENITSNCSGLNAKNITSLKDKVMAAGLFSVAGTAGGVAGGVLINNAKDTMDLTTTAISGASAVTAIVSAILAGTSAAELKKNSDIADKCKMALSGFASITDDAAKYKK